MTRQTLDSPPPSLGAYGVVTAADGGSTPSLLTEMKSEAAVGADQRSAPHSSPGVLMASDNTGGRRTDSPSAQCRVTSVDSEREM